MQKEIKNIENATVDLFFTFDKNEVNRARNSAYKRYQRSLNINGFRKGKVPYSVAQQLLGPDFLNETISLDLLNSNLDATLDELKIPVNSQIIIKDFELKSDGTLEATVQFGTTPEIKLSDNFFELINSSDDLETIDTSEEYLDQEFEKRLEPVLIELAEKQSSDEPVKNGDYVNLEILDTNAIRPIPQFDSFAVGYESPYFPVSIQEELIGHQVGDELEISNEDNNETFKVKVNDISTYKKPEYTDEFISENLFYGDKDEFKAAYKDMIRDELVSKIALENGLKIFDRLAEDSNVVISDLTIAELKDELTPEIIEYLNKKSVEFANSEDKREAYIDYYKNLELANYLTRILGFRPNENEQTFSLILQQNLVNRDLPDFSSSDNPLLNLFSRELILDDVVKNLGLINSLSALQGGDEVVEEEENVTETNDSSENNTDSANLEGEDSSES